MYAANGALYRRNFLKDSVPLKTLYLSLGPFPLWSKPNSLFLISLKPPISKILTELWIQHSNVRIPSEIYLSVANKYTILKDWNVNLSVDYQWNTLDATLHNFAYPTRNSLLIALATAYKWRGLKGQASLLGTFVNDRSTANISTGSVTRLTKSHEELTPALEKIVEIATQIFQWFANLDGSTQPYHPLLKE